MASAEPTRNGTTAAVRLFGRHAASQATPARAVPEVPAHDARGADDDAVAREARADAGDTPRAERRVRMAKSRHRKMTRTSARKKLLPPSDPRAFFVANFGPSVPSSDPSARGATTMLRLAAFLALLLPVSAGTGAPPRHPARVFSPPAHASIPPPITQCDERWRDAPLDHFSFSSDATYRQRYFLCRRYAHPTDPVLFFYTGNEANVELYLNATGIMWESAERFGAALVFAEHRYYGQSRPSTYDPDSDAPLRDQLAHLTSEQAMADYATLVRDVLRELRAPDAPVVVFGGSYGGMLATWMRNQVPVHRRRRRRGIRARVVLRGRRSARGPGRVRDGRHPRRHRRGRRFAGVRVQRPKSLRRVASTRRRRRRDPSVPGDAASRVSRMGTR